MATLAQWINVLVALGLAALAIDRWVHGRQLTDLAQEHADERLADRMQHAESDLKRLAQKCHDLSDLVQALVIAGEIMKTRLEYLDRRKDDQ